MSGRREYDRCTYFLPFCNTKYLVEGMASWVMPNSLERGGWYSLDGRRIVGKPSAKGIYINNGRKVVIK